MVIVLVLALVGCGGPKAGPEAVGEAMTWGELVGAHNARVGAIERLWARAVVEARWVDGQGKKQFEQGDGPLILRKPDELALAIGKLGHTRLWLGSDGQRYWLFDLTGEQRVAYVGKLDADSAARAQAAGLPVPIRPDRLIELSGLSALPADQRGDVKRIDGGYRVTLDADAEAGRPARRLTFDADGMLTRYAVLDGEGEPAVVSTLGRYERLPLVGQSTGAYPLMPTRIAVELPGREASMTLFLSQMTDEPGKVRAVHFDFGKLSRLHRIDRTVDVDRRAERSGR